MMHSEFCYVFYCKTRGRNKPKISRANWALDIEKLRATISFFFRARFGFSNIFYTSVIEMSPHFHGPFGPLVLKFCGPSLNFEGNWPKGLPYFNPCVKLHDSVEFTYHLLTNFFRSCLLPLLHLQQIHMKWKKILWNVQSAVIVGKETAQVAFYSKFELKTKLWTNHGL